MALVIIGISMRHLIAAGFLLGLWPALAGATVMQSSSTGTSQTSGAYLTYYWALATSSGITGSGVLTTGAIDGQGVDILSFRGSIAGGQVALTGTGHSSYVTSPNGAFYYDNRLFVNSDPVLDLGGILFSINGHEANIWGTGAGKYSYWTWMNGHYDYSNDSSVFTVTKAPEPGGLLLTWIPAGFVIAYFSRRKIAKGKPPPWP